MEYDLFRFEAVGDVQSLFKRHQVDFLSRAVGEIYPAAKLSDMDCCNRNVEIQLVSVCLF